MHTCFLKLPLPLIFCTSLGVSPHLSPCSPLSLPPWLLSLLSPYGLPPSFFLTVRMSLEGMMSKGSTGVLLPTSQNNPQNRRQRKRRERTSTVCLFVLKLKWKHLLKTLLFLLMCCKRNRAQSINTQPPDKPPDPQHYCHGSVPPAVSPAARA